MSRTRPWIRLAAGTIVGALLVACELASHSTDFGTKDEVVDASLVVYVCAMPDVACAGDGGTSCADLSSDNANCGTCGSACAGALVCSSGKCATSCGAAETHCSTGCFDLDVNAKHCGSCDTACAAGEVCSSGKCAGTCGAGTKQCGTACVPDEFGSECGACAGGGTCPTGACVAGFCVVSATSTTDTCLSKCDGACVDPLTDRNNCGACGHVCPGAKQICINGACCNGSDMCSGACTSLATDTSNCGTCGNACPGTQVCAGGSCCTKDVCSGACTDVSADLANCGSCGHACAAGQICTSGVCCGPTQQACDGACFDLVDHDHCGSCGKGCMSNQICASAAGTCSYCLASIARDGGALRIDAGAGDGPIGVGIGDDGGSDTHEGKGLIPEAMGGELACNNVCTNTGTDVNNCGACGNACPAVSNGSTMTNAVCCAGSCCNGTCVSGTCSQ